MIRPFELLLPDLLLKETVFELKIGLIPVSLLKDPILGSSGICKADVPVVVLCKELQFGVGDKGNLVNPKSNNWSSTLESRMLSDLEANKGILELSNLEIDLVIDEFNWMVVGEEPYMSCLFSLSLVSVLVLLMVSWGVLINNFLLLDLSGVLCKMLLAFSSPMDVALVVISFLAF